MKKIFSIISILFISILGLNAQNTTVPEVNIEPSSSDDVFTIVEKMPEFPGGETALIQFLEKNIKYPHVAMENGIQGKVWMSFIVGKDGAVSKVEVLRGIGGGCDEEAIRVVKLMPKWNPGYQNGKPVTVSYRIPIKFTLK